MRRGTVPKRYGITQERVAPTSELSGLIPGYKWNLFQSSPKHQKQGKVRGADTATAEVSSQPNTTYILSISSIFSTVLESKFIHNSQMTRLSLQNVPITVWLIPPQLQVPEIMYYLSFHILTTGILSVSIAFINSLNCSFDCLVLFSIFIFHYFHDKSNINESITHK